jgi:hypothetical protein
MVSNPSSTMTSQFAAEALEDRGLLRALVRTLIAPVPYGQDGESEGDADLEEKVVRWVFEQFYPRCSTLTT